MSRHRQTEALTKQILRSVSERIFGYTYVTGDSGQLLDPKETHAQKALLPGGLAMGTEPGAQQQLTLNEPLSICILYSLVASS